MTTPKLDGKPSLLIRCSAGGETDPRLFYSSTYRTFFHERNTMSNSPIERKLNTQFRWNEPDPSLVRRKVQAAGYQRNLLPCFDYDKAVDEYDQFRDDNHFDTVMGTSYAKPHEKPMLPTRTAPDGRPYPVGIAHTPELSKYQPLQSAADVKQDGKWNVFESTMKSSYKSNAMFPHLDETGHVKVTGKDHESGWVRDRPHEIAGLSDHLTNLERGIQSVTLAESIARANLARKAYRVTQLGATGYNRADAVLPESDSSKAYTIPVLTLEKLRKSHPEDHAFFTQSPHNRDPTIPLATNGQQQPTAAIHNTPDPALLSVMQFRSWETSYSASYDPRASTKLVMADAAAGSPVKKNAPAVASPSSPVHIRVNRATDALHSGYTMSNKYEFEPMVKAGEALRGPSGRDGGDPNGISDAMQRRAAQSRDRSVAKQRV